MEAFLTALLFGLGLWVIGDILDRREQKRRDREHFAKWGRPRR